MLSSEEFKYFEYIDDFDFDFSREDYNDEIFICIGKKKGNKYLNHLITSFHEEYECTFPPIIFSSSHNLERL